MNVKKIPKNTGSSQPEYETEKIGIIRCIREGIKTIFGKSILLGSIAGAAGLWLGYQWSISNMQMVVDGDAAKIGFLQEMEFTSGLAGKIKNLQMPFNDVLIAAANQNLEIDPSRQGAHRHELAAEKVNLEKRIEELHDFYMNHSEYFTDDFYQKILLELEETYLGARSIFALMDEFVRLPDGEARRKHELYQIGYEKMKFFDEKLDAMVSLILERYAVANEKSQKQDHVNVALQAEIKMNTRITVAFTAVLIALAVAGGLLAMGLNAVQRRRVREMLDDLDTTFDRMGDGAVKVDNDCRIVKFNRQAEKLTGYSREEAYGKPIEEIFHLTDENKNPIEHPLRAAIRNGTTKYLTNSKMIRKKDGTWIYIAESSAPVGNGAIFIFSDMTETYQKNEQMKLKVKLAKNILYFIDKGIPRYVEFGANTIMFAEAIQIPCLTEGGDHLFMMQQPPSSDHPSGRTIVSVKDQSGHEVPCLQRAIITDFHHQAILNQNPGHSLEWSLNELNKKLSGSGLFGEEEYFTAIDMEINHASRCLRYSSGGHPPFFVIRGSEIIRMPKPEENGHNLMYIIFDDRQTIGEFQLEPGDKIFVYTDGLVDAGIGSINELERLVIEHAHLPVNKIAREILAAASRRSGKKIDPAKKINETEDDITVIGMEILKFEERVLQPQNQAEFEAISNRMVKEIFKPEWEKREYEKFFRFEYTFLEMLANAYEHGNKYNPDKKITVKWSWGDDLVVEIIDEGNGFDLDKVPDPTADENIIKERGRGIFTTKLLASRARWLGYRVRLMFKKHPPEKEQKEIVAGVKWMNLWRKTEHCSEAFG